MLFFKKIKKKKMKKVYDGELVMKLATRNEEIFSFMLELLPEILDPKKYILKRGLLGVLFVVFSWRSPNLT